MDVAGRQLRIGLIGAGKMGLNHLRAIRGCTGVEVVGVADPAADEEQLRPLLPVAAVVVDSAEALFERVRPDVVHIVTPPATHVHLALEAIRRGAHVYVEKPFSLTRAEAEQVLAAADAAGLTVCAGHQCLFDDAAVAARALLPALGRTVHVESFFSFHTVRRSITPVDQAKDILPHAVYMLIDFMRSASRSGDPLAIGGLAVDADGGVHGLLSSGDGCRGTVIVTLAGRPVAQYVKVVGTNGWLQADLVTGAVVGSTGPGTNIGAAVLNPFRESFQRATRSGLGIVRRFRDRKYGYPGLRPLCQAFYDAIRRGAPSPVSRGAIIETVAVCERVGDALDAAEQRAQEAAQLRLDGQEKRLPAAVRERGTVLLTGAGGFLGSAVARELRASGWPVRAIVRRPLRTSSREPGVEYVECDLARGIPPRLMEDVSAVVHCAAETRGGRVEQERNSIAAAREVVEAAAAAGVRRVIHISSVAVLQPSSQPLHEDSPVEAGTLVRGPYVWGKAESELLVKRLAAARGLDLRVIRLGPLVDLGAFEPPGRLGRELGPFFVAVGPRRSRLALIDVHRAAAVIGSYLTDFAAAPPTLNLVEPEAPTRAELVRRLLATRSDLRVIWIPMFMLKLLSPPLKLMQRIVLRSPQPLDIASAFSAPTYRTELVGRVFERANREPQAR